MLHLKIINIFCKLNQFKYLNLNYVKNGRTAKGREEDQLSNKNIVLAGDWQKFWYLTCYWIMRERQREERYNPINATESEFSKTKQNKKNVYSFVLPNVK